MRSCGRAFVTGVEGDDDDAFKGDEKSRVGWTSTLLEASALEAIIGIVTLAPTGCGRLNTFFLSSLYASSAINASASAPICARAACSSRSILGGAGVAALEGSARTSAEGCAEATICLCEGKPALTLSCCPLSSLWIGAAALESSFSAAPEGTAEGCEEEAKRVFKFKLCCCRLDGGPDADAAAPCEFDIPLLTKEFNDGAGRLLIVILLFNIYIVKYYFIYI